MTGKRVTLKASGEAGTVNFVLPQIRNEQKEILDIPHYVWTSDLDGKMYASKAEDMIETGT